jgi:CTP:molybdopterin cytidylyltransferase MocA
VINEVLRAEAGPVFAVISPASTAVAEILNGLPVTVVTNLLSDGDMLSSVRCGLMALPAECTGFLLVLGDQPGITAVMINRLIDAGRSSQKSMVLPVCQGRRGHPLLVSLVHRDEILTRHDGTGLRGLLQSHPGDIEEVPVDDPGCLEDMDFPEDYARLSGKRAAD